MHKLKKQNCKTKTMTCGILSLAIFPYEKNNKMIFPEK